MMLLKGVYKFPIFALFLMPMQIPNRSANLNDAAQQGQPKPPKNKPVNTGNAPLLHFLA